LYLHRIKLDRDLKDKKEEHNLLLLKWTIKQGTRKRAPKRSQARVSEKLINYQ
jgi:hypothetical protein